MGKYFFNKDAIAYLAPRLYATFGNQLNECIKSHDRTYKDSAYSLGLIILEFCF